MPKGIKDLFIQVGAGGELHNMMKSEKYREIKDSPSLQLFICQIDFKFEYVVCTCSLPISRCKLIIETFDNPSTRNLMHMQQSVSRVAGSVKNWTESLNKRTNQAPSRSQEQLGLPVPT